ncbi:MAG: phosphoribosylanthranilate isomerase [bacterium]|nr:phosphoribosylanthranilate isomerase [bacterium]
MITQIYETQNYDEAKKLVELGVDYVGVLVGIKDEYPGELSPEQAVEVLRGVTGHSKKVVLSLSKNLNDIVIIVNKTNPDILHLPAEPDALSPANIQTLKKQFPNVKVMRTIPVGDEGCVELAKQYDGIADYLLLDSRRKSDSQIGATGETHDWNLSRKIVESVSTPVILAGGLGVDNLAEAILKVKPFGVDSKSKTDKVGSREKDIEKVKEFVKIAKATGNKINC